MIEKLLYSKSVFGRRVVITIVPPKSTGNHKACYTLTFTHRLSKDSRYNYETMMPLSSAQYAEFRTWLNKQRIDKFNTIVEYVASGYSIGAGWEVNWNKIIKPYLISVMGCVP